VIVHQAYRFALDPTPRQQGALASHVGGARFAYNWGLELVKRRLEERAAGQDVEVPWTLPTLRRAWNRAKDGSRPGGRKTPRKPTARAWTRWRAGCATGPIPSRAAAPASAWDFHAANARATAGRRAGSPPARFGWKPTATM